MVKILINKSNFRLPSLFIETVPKPNTFEKLDSYTYEKIKKIINKKNPMKYND